MGEKNKTQNGMWFASIWFSQKKKKKVHHGASYCREYLWNDSSLKVYS